MTTTTGSWPPITVRSSTSPTPSSPSGTTTCTRGSWSPSEFWKMPAYTWAVKAVNAIPVYRKTDPRGSFDAAIRSLKDGDSVAIMPEGGPALGSGPAPWTSAGSRAGSVDWLSDQACRSCQSPSSVASVSGPSGTSSPASSPSDAGRCWSGSPASRCGCTATTTAPTPARCARSRRHCYVGRRRIYRPSTRRTCRTSRRRRYPVRLSVVSTNTPLPTGGRPGRRPAGDVIGRSVAGPAEPARQADQVRHRRRDQRRHRHRIVGAVAGGCGDRDPHSHDHRVLGPRCSTTSRSIEPGRSACRLFVPRSPGTSSSSV